MATTKLIAISFKNSPDISVIILATGAPELYFPLQIANGVTSVHDMNGPMSFENIEQLRDSIYSKKKLGPCPIYAPGPLLDGPRPESSMAENVISLNSKE